MSKRTAEAIQALGKMFWCIVLHVFSNYQSNIIKIKPTINYYKYLYKYTVCGNLGMDEEASLLGKSAFFGKILLCGIL